MYLLDETWLPFSNLMLKHIYNVLLICSDYDRFTLEEDGRVEEELYKEYTQLGLSNPPKISHTNNPDEALSMINRLNFDLVITMLDLESNKVEKLAEEIKKIKYSMPIIALSPSPDHRKARVLKGENCPYIDYLFYWQGNASLFLAMIKLIEDRMNIEHDTKEADVQVIILVEDSVRFISSYLPQMYTCLIQQNRSSILEALNEWGKTLRMRGRPKIVLARTYKEASDLFYRYRENILGVIADVSFPSEKGKEKAGIELLKEIKNVDKEIPVLIQSRDIRYKEEAEENGADFLYKLSETLLQDLSDHFIKRYNFGPFNVIDPDTGKSVATADTMRGVQNLIKTMDIRSFVYHSRRNDFSRWLRAQSLYRLAGMIKGINLNDRESAEETREKLYRTIRDYRLRRARGVIAEFSLSRYDETLHFSRIGKGSMGGKGRGLAFLSLEMLSSSLAEKYDSVNLSIPRTVVITTELFDTFMEENNLKGLQFCEESDEDILRLFLSKKIPCELKEDLVEILKVTTDPLSIRSSSLLEDSHFHPFAGVYETCMLSNRGSFSSRLEALEMAIKTVWASTYFSRARVYLKSTDHTLEEEKMAVIIQQITGSAHSSLFFPSISGVARSLNYYPAPGQEMEDGVGLLSFGFGKMIVDEGTGFRFCPAKPKKPSMNLSGTEISPQSFFYALDLSGTFDPASDIDNLKRIKIEEAYEKYPEALKNIASSFDPSGFMRECVDKNSVNMLTFNGILKYGSLPLAKIVNDTLKLGEKAMAEPVEIEFAVNTQSEKPEFTILQLRPISELTKESSIEVREEEKEGAIIFSDMVMGNGSIENIRDIVTIDPHLFKAKDMAMMASELRHFNSKIGSDYILITAGRLGSSDPWLGIPCSWSDISNARVIAEASVADVAAEPSQGTHFFQNMTSLGAIYLTVQGKLGRSFVNFKKLESMNVIERSSHFMHIKSDEPLIVKADGKNQMAVVKEEKDA